MDYTDYKKYIDYMYVNHQDIINDKLCDIKNLSSGFKENNSIKDDSFLDIFRQNNINNETMTYIRTLLLSQIDYVYDCLLDTNKYIYDVERFEKDVEKVQNKIAKQIEVGFDESLISQIFSNPLSIRDDDGLDAWELLYNDVSTIWKIEEQVKNEVLKKPNLLKKALGLFSNRINQKNYNYKKEHISKIKDVLRSEIHDDLQNGKTRNNYVQAVVNYIERGRRLSKYFAEAKSTTNMMLGSLSEAYNKDSSIYIEDILKGLRNNLGSKITNEELGTEYKTTQNRLGKDSKLKLSKPEDVRNDLKNLQTEYHAILNGDYSSKSEYIDAIAEISYKFLIIHPFDNGNGRTSRGLINNLFISNDMIPPVLYNDVYQKGKEYGKALTAADSGDFSPLKQLFYQKTALTLQSLTDIKIDEVIQKIDSRLKVNNSLEFSL